VARIKCVTEILRYAAFTRDPAGGNPAGIVLDAGGLTGAGMLAIAASVGYSETAFIVSSEPPPPPPPRHLGGSSQAGGSDNSPAPSTYRVRYFSPEIEVPFCGHATIATAVALGPGRHLFRTDAGDVPITVDRSGTATLTSVPPSVDDLGPAEVTALLAALHYDHSDLDGSLPPKVAYAGARHPVVALATRARLAALDYDFDALKQLMTARDWTTVQLVHRAADGTFDVRNPFPVGGVREDPATGAAAAALGGYLRELRIVPDGAVLTVRQGDDMGRPSRITVTLTPGRAGIDVSGTAVPITG
jgi:PhzF family phenazine biosynthesis protein